MHLLKNIFFIFITIFIINHRTHAQSVIDDISESSSDNFFLSELSEEKIIKISPSKRVFIITNENNSFNKGDFISLVFEDALVCRAIAAKLTNGVSGIKIVKIYSMNLWSKMLPNVRVKILRGDDSYFLKGKKEKREENDLKIQDEEDLFNDTVLSEDSSLEENTKRLIKTDNIVSISYGTMAGVDINSDSTSYTLLNGAWAYQLADNVWGEARYGQTIIRDFPNLELDTTLTNFVASLKYTVEAPFDSYIQPYIGYQVVQASSPLAETEDEEALLDLSKSSKPVFGVTLLKRFVPAWFIKANLGSDLVSVGMALEF